METQLFIYKKIALHFYYSKKSFTNGKVTVDNIFVYFPGLPQILNEEFFQDKVNKNNAFFSVYYLGSWLSGGSFTYNNCKKTVELVIQFIKNKEGVKVFSNNKLRWNYKNLHVMGYSFSGNPVISAKLSKTDVKSVILFAPLLFVNRKEVAEYLKEKKAIDNFFSFSLFYLGFIRKGYKFVFRGIENRCWDKYFSGSEIKSLVNVRNSYPDNIFIFHGKADKKISYKSSLFFQQKRCPQAKVFIIKRAGHDLRQICDFRKILKLI